MKVSNIAALSVVFFISVNAIAAGPMCADLFSKRSNKSNAPSVVVISGTNREGANSLKVAETMRELLLDEGAQVEVLDLAKVPPTTYSSQNYSHTPKTFQKKFDEPIAKAESIVVVVPEYFGSFPGILKTFFDYVQAPLAGKSITLVGISAGKWGARNALAGFAETLTHRKASVSGTSRINIENVESKVDETQVIDADIRKRMKSAAQEIVESMVAQRGEEVPVEKLQKLVTAQIHSEVSLNSGLTVSGTLSNVILNEKNNSVAYIQTSGPTSLKDQYRTHVGQTPDMHKTGFGTPVGVLKNGIRISTLKNPEDIGLIEGERAKLEFSSGVVVEGTFVRSQKSRQGYLQIVTFMDCTVTLNGKFLFRPSWGRFDMGVGESVVQVKL
ncbi:NAD(P)H-dependent oxidoreductase [Bdellovibrio sp. HCB2-146]|uniref:NAD(P)H-dependent oxidoreductase n=1 Tax=Bdellovibrio sp. HCB2-146 TaxID=3394362 RepID=UPI0039BC4A2E